MTTVGAGAQTGSVSGVVFDSITSGPLVDAAVFLWDTPYQAATDENGAFEIEDVPAGRYQILFFHTRLGEMGISPGQRALVVEAGETARVSLATPSMGTVISSQCLMEDHPAGTGIVAGLALDGATSLRLGGAGVSLSWTDPETRATERLAMRTSPAGWYYTCRAPADTPMLASASFFDRQSARREVSVEADGFSEIGFVLSPLEPSEVAGRLVDAASGRPVRDAEVGLRGTDQRVTTSGSGAFDLGEVPPGTYMLVADHLAYGTKMDTLSIPSGAHVTVEMSLDERPIEIAPITVTVEAPEPISAHMGGGITLTSEDMDPVRQRSRDASDIIRSLHLPGVIVRHNANGICVGYSSGQVKMMQTGCVPMVIYINDVRATSPDMALRLPPDAIERMVVYKPIEASNLFGLGGASGVWMIYTRGN